MAARRFGGAAVTRARRRWALTIRTKAGHEVEVSLHPISLVRLFAEVLDDAANSWCRRVGHVDHDGHCERCGLFLPDNGTPYGSWLPDAYRTIREVQP